MADYNSVPLGVAGTGAAYILPQDNTAAQQYVRQNERNQQLQLLQNQQRIRQAQLLAKSYQDNMLKAKAGILWNNEISEGLNNHLQKGIQYRKMGIDIYNPNPADPAQMKAHQDYMLERAQLENMQNVRGEMEKRYNEQNKAYAAAVPGTYNNRSMDAIQGFVSNNKLADVVNNGLQLPELQKAYNANEFFSKIQPVTYQTSAVQGGLKTDQKKMLSIPTRENVIAAMQNDPGMAQYVQEETGLTPQTAKLIPDKFSDIRKQNLDEYDGNPRVREALAKQGITSKSDPRFDDYIQQLSQSQYDSKQKFNGFVNMGINQARTKAGEFLKQNPDFTLENQNMKRTKFAERNDEKSGKDTEALYRQDLVNRMWTGVPGSGEELKATVKGSGKFDRDMNIDVQGNKILISVPPQKIITSVDGEEKVTTKPARNITIDKNNPKDKIALNTLISEVTGEKISQSKFMTEGGKGKVSGGMGASQVNAPRTISRSEIGIKASAAGYSVKEYEKLLLQKGIKIK